MIFLLLFTLVIFIGLIFVVLFLETDENLREFLYVIGAMAGGSLITVIGTLVGKLKESEPVPVRVLPFSREEMEEMV